MATKTISVSLEAYERLANARTEEKESFSRVICRAEWPPKAGTSRDLLQQIEKWGDSVVDVALLDKAQESDPPPVDPWDEE